MDVDVMTADAIVRKLAVSEWVYDHVWCFQCHAGVAYDAQSNVIGVNEPHGADCVYAAAVRYVEANPA